MKYDLSILVSNFNYEKYLTSCLNRLCNQTVNYKELIIIDDCSTDKSSEIIIKFKKKFKFIKFIQNKKNMGIIYNQKKLLELSKSNYIYFASTDDIVEKNFVEESMIELLKYKKANLVFSYSCFINKKKKNIIRKPYNKKPILYSPNEINLVLNYIFHFNCNSIIFKKQAFIKCGAFLNNKLRSNWDMVTFHAMAYDTGAVFIPKPLAFHRIHDDQWSASKKNNHEMLTSYFDEIKKNKKITKFKKYFIESGIHALFLGSLFFLIKNPKYLEFLSFNFLYKKIIINIKYYIKRLLKFSIFNI